ncbi:MAG TPA: hypothetical protein PLU16_14850 [Gallionellaceae bacterium]|jgi:hypothetical protein|nr:hypothetical protein [Gallionellaceae bacterium]HQS76483.1 hypothetical protein [Gallionellaceae bacterium]
MATVTNSPAAREILEFLKSKLEIPDDVVGLTLHLKTDDLIKIECEYIPKLKETANGKT